MQTKRVVNFRLNETTLKHLDTITHEMNKKRVESPWLGKFTRTSALEHAAERLAVEIEEKARIAVDQASKPKPKKRKGKAK